MTSSIGVGGYFYEARKSITNFCDPEDWITGQPVGLGLQLCNVCDNGGLTKRDCDATTAHTH